MPKILKNYRLPSELIARLDEYAASIGVDRTELLEKALGKYLDEVAAEKAEERMASIQNEQANLAKIMERRSKGVNRTLPKRKQSDEP